MKDSSDILTIDGSQGEGGGQILRSSVALSLLTGRGFRITRIRAGRPKPGLARQHLTAVLAAQQVGNAEVRGAALGSTELTFTPREVRAGEYRFDVGTAGSATLVLQTVLPPLLRASGASQVTLCGGTHNPHAPPFDFLAKTFAPIVNRLAEDMAAPPVLALELVRPGFFPAGGGEMTATITPPRAWRRLGLTERGAVRFQRARAIVAHLSPQIAERELRVVKAGLALGDDCLCVEEAASSRGPGNAVVIELGFEHVTEVITAFGSRGVPAEAVARQAVEEARRYLASDAPVGEHLADQLLLPLVAGAGGAFRTVAMTPHTVTNIKVIRRFVEVAIEVMEETGAPGLIHVRGGMPNLRLPAEGTRTTMTNER